MVGVTALAIAIFAVPLALAVRQLYRDQIVLRLEREATQAAAAAEDIDRTERAWLLMALLALAAVGVAAAVAGWQARRLSQPVAALAGTAGRLGQGDFTSRAPRSGVAEVDAVAETMDATA